MSKKNHTRIALLGLLTTGCQTGYEIKQMIDNSLNHFWKQSYGQIYPNLKRLVEEELATVTSTAQEGKPDKKEYQITQKGKKELKAWLSAPADLPSENNEMLLKVFFSRHLNPTLTVTNLENYLGNLEEKRQTYLSIEEMISSCEPNHEDAIYWLFTLDYGKRTVSAAIEWCKDTIKILNEKKEEDRNG